MASEPLTNALQSLRRAALLHEHAGLSDAQLLEHFLGRRDDAAFELLLRRHGPMVYGVCRRVLGNAADAEDAFQATFLVLFRKAAAVRPRSLVGNWLYGVAYNTALKARAATAKRRAKEREAAAMAPPHVPDEVRRQLQAALDEALHALPEKYRAPVVLCDLEGRTRKEAAARLGWSEGTVASRLARARVLLGRRLSRHGLPCTAGALAAALAETAVAGMPAALVERTMQTVTSAAVPAGIAVLSQGVINTMFWKKAARLILAVAFLGSLGTGVGAFFAPGRGGDASPARVGEAAPPLDRKRLLDEFARADTVFVGKVVRADLEETFWSGWAMSTREVVYEVSKFLKGGDKELRQFPARFLILGGPTDAYYRDGDRPRLNPRLFAPNAEHLVCVNGSARENLVGFVTPLFREATAALRDARQESKAVPFKEIFRAFDGGPREAAEKVIRTPEEWQKFIQSCKERAVRQQLERTTVDFEKDLVVAVGFGPFRDSLTAPERKECGVTRVLATDDSVWVKYVIVRSDEIAPDAAYPVFVVTLPRGKKRVFFEKHETPGG